MGYVALKSRNELFRSNKSNKEPKGNSCIPRDSRDSYTTPDNGDSQENGNDPAYDGDVAGKIDEAPKQHAKRSNCSRA
ncbi:MAG: hypothetical protein ACI87A_003519, partial [Planctomycetota bacterium]